MRRAVAVAVAVAACGEGEKFTVEQLQDPTTCMQCHPKHYDQWSGSMHAYAAEDPVFLAMNRRGQRETQGRLGDFCINCHAPMAKQLGFTDFANFDPATLPPAARGITCYFCHNVKDVTSTHDNGLALANDQTMRGGLRGAVGTEAHHSKYDLLMDSELNQSEICGSCHDIVVPASINGLRDVALERTFAEWKETFFASSEDPNLHVTCGGCHMASSRLEPIADAPGVKPRENGFHDHMFAAIDVALTTFPQIPEQLEAVHDILDPAIRIVGASVAGSQNGGICITPLEGGTVTVRIDSIGPGHSFPSGAAQDRRAWLEVIAYGAGDAVLFQSGVVPAGVDPELAPPDVRCIFEGAVEDDVVCGFWDRTLKANGAPAHFFWEVDRLDPKGRLLRAPSMPKEDVSETAKIRFNFNRPPPLIDRDSIERVTARFRFNPLPYAMIDELIASGDLAPGIRDQVKTLEVGAPRVWLKSTAIGGCN